MKQIFTGQALLLMITLAVLSLHASVFPTAVFSETGDRAETAETVTKTETALEKQVRVVASKLRCPVCQGESIYDSHSDVAVEMKKLIAEKLSAGESEEAILGYFQARYGNFILMEPPAEGLHWVIWVFPVFLGLVGFILVYQFITGSSRRKTMPPPGDKDHKPENTNKSGGGTAPDVRELQL